MGNKARQRWILFLGFIGFSVAVCALAPRFTGILIFVRFVILARIGNLNKIEAVYERQREKEPDYTSTSRGQRLYSQQYSMKKDESHEAVKDKPLSEAERNVLYG